MPLCWSPNRRADSPCGFLPFPEIVTYGNDEKEAVAMAEDAIRLVLEDCIARGEPLPGGEPPRIREVTITPAA